MSDALKIEVVNAAPERVYVFPEKLTRQEINEKVGALHTIANNEANQTIYCLFDDVAASPDMKYEVCFPHSHLDLKKYKETDFKVMPRELVVTCEFVGEIDKIRTNLNQLLDYAQKNGYEVKPPFRFLFILHKKPLFSKQPPKFTMEIQVPVKNKK